MERKHLGLFSLTVSAIDSKLLEGVSVLLLVQLKSLREASQEASLILQGPGIGSLFLPHSPHDPDLTFKNSFHSIPFSSLFFPWKLLLAFLSLCLLFVLVFAMIVFVFEEA